MRGWTQADIEPVPGKPKLKRKKYIKRNAPLKNVSSSESARAKARAWEWFSKFIRLRDSIRTTGTKDNCRCVTCGNMKPSFTTEDCIQAGHWLGGRTGKNLFDENAVHGQCTRCNKYLHGNNANYTEYMMERYGQEECDRITRQANTSHRYAACEFREISDKYREKFNELKSS